MNPRLIALDILTKLENDYSNSAILLAEALSKVPDSRDRNLITDLVLGILRWRGKLLYWIEVYSNRKIGRIDLKIRTVLQIGIYQLVFQQASAHAAVFESVELCRKVKLSSAASFVNGILRRIQREAPGLREPEEPFLRWSHPEWLAKRWEERFGREEAELLMKTNNALPPVFLRVNELIAKPQDVQEHLASENVRVKTTTFGTGILEVVEGSAQKTTSFENGEFYIQDAAVETLNKMIDRSAGDRVLEIAAAPGGKTLQLAMAFRNGFLTSLDSDLKRMRIWQVNVERLHIRGVHPVIGDARALPFLEFFDQVVIDAPCSSLGVIRRHPEIKWWRKPEHLAGIQVLQKAIIRAAMMVLRRGGSLIYSVCSFEPEETTEVTGEFGPEQEIFLYPHKSGTDGFYFSKMTQK
jgi:16S rRNA (cytosine967-C5)-methyltransferase